MKKEKSKEKTTSESNMPEDAVMHDNGNWYREFEVPGIDKPVRLFNSLKPQRLDGETQSEYKIRRKFLKHKDSTKTIFHNSGQLGTYIKNK